MQFTFLENFKEMEWPNITIYGSIDIRNKQNLFHLKNCQTEVIFIQKKNVTYL